MGNYDEYLNKLKGSFSSYDGDKMYLKIESRIHNRTHVVPYAVGGMLLLLMGFVVYFNSYSYFLNNQVSVRDYVFQNKETNSNSIMNYVYVD